MKKLLTFLTLFTLFCGVGWAADVEYKTLTFPDGNSQGVSSYSNSWYATIDGFRWDITNFNNNNNGWTYIKAGSKNAAYVGSITTNSTIDKAITKVVVTVDACTASSINSTSLEIASNSGFSSNLQTVTLAASTGELTYNVPTPTANQYYRLKFDCKRSSSNGVITISKVQYFYSDGGSAPTTYSITGTGAVTGGNVTASATSNITAGTSITITATPSTGYELSNLTVDGNDVTSSVNNNEYTFNMPAHDVAVSATFTEQSTPQPSGPTTFERINSTSDLEAGKRYILVYETTPAGMGAITTSGTKYGTSVTGSSNITVTNGVATLPSGSTVKVLTLGGNATDGWTFDLDGSTLNQTAKNSLSTGSSNNTWTISFSGNNVTITNKSYTYNNASTTIKYNSSSGQERFAGYTSGQQAIQLYKEVTSTTSDKLYLIGKDMNSQSNWNISTGPEFTYSSSAGTYAVDAYFDMASRGYFQFVEGLSDSNSNWGGLTGRYYASGDGDVAVDNFDMDGTVPLYFTNSTQYSPGQYAFTVPAGLYTIVVDKPNWKIYVTQHEVTMTATASASFDDSKNVTLGSNLTAAPYNGKIYYTTDGSTPSATNGTEYTGTITLNATTTIKAIAILNHIQSDVVERTYTKRPAAPVISPASCTFNEPLTVTITAESGATIYYTTDGSTPTNESTQYNGPFTVSTTTTVKAKAYVGEAYSQTAEATYTYSNVQPSTGDFELVTSASQLVPGNEYIILSYDEDYNYAMGSISSSKGNPVTDFTLNGTLGASGSTVSAGTTVNVLTLGGTTGAWTLKQADDQYIIPAASATGISTGSACNLVITIGNDYAANIQNSETSDSRQIRYSTSGYFRNYTTNQSGTNEVYLYYRESNAVQNPVFSPVPGIYNVDIDVTISCATDGATIYYTTDGSEPSATNGTEYTGEMVVSESTTFKAIAVKDGNTSSVVTAAYTINKNTEIATVTLDYSEPFTAGIGNFTIDNVSGFSPVWSLDGNYGVKGTSYSPTHNPTNQAAVSRLVSPIIDMTGSVQPSLTFSHQINSYFNNVASQCQVFIRETTDGTDGSWVQIPITFSDPTTTGTGWTNDIAVVDLTNINGVSYADKKVQISFLYTNRTEGSGAGTWEIQNFVVADNSEYRMVNNIAEFLALDNGITAKFKNPVTVLYDYAQTSSYEYIWVKDESGYMQFYLKPSLNESQKAFYENGDIIPKGFVVTKNYYEYGSYVQAYSKDALNAGFLPATQKGLADPDFYEFNTLHNLALDNATIKEHCNRYITLEKIQISSKSGKNFNFANEDGTIVNNCIGYNKFSDDGCLEKDGSSAVVSIPAVSSTLYNVKAILQLWKGNNNETKWEILPIEFTEWAADEVTLRKLCADGVETHEYKISNNVMGVYASGNSLWVKDDTGQSIHETEPAANDQSYYIDAQGNTREEQANYDQSNWCELVLTSGNAGDFVNKIIKGGAIQGTFANKTNPKMTDVSLSDNHIASKGSYAPNYYCMANFLDHTGDYLSQQGNDRNNYFFMNPKPQEYATITWAMWNNGMFVIPESDHYTDDNGTHYINYWDFNGAVSANWSLNTVGENGAAVDQSSALNNYPNGVFEFNAIIRVEDYTPSTSNGAPRRAIGSKDGQEQYVSRNIVIYPTNLDLSGNDHVITAVNDVKAAGEVLSVTYYNVAGVQSSKPFDGINIVVTRYTDGTASTAKVVR